MADLGPGKAAITIGFEPGLDVPSCEDLEQLIADPKIDKEFVDSLGGNDHVYSAVPDDEPPPASAGIRRRSDLLYGVLPTRNFLYGSRWVERLPDRARITGEIKIWDITSLTGGVSDSEKRLDSYNLDKQLRRREIIMDGVPVVATATFNIEAHNVQRSGKTTCEVSGGGEIDATPSGVAKQGIAAGKVQEKVNAELIKFLTFIVKKANELKASRQRGTSAPSTSAGAAIAPAPATLSTPTAPRAAPATAPASPALRAASPAGPVAAPEAMPQAAPAPALKGPLAAKARAVQINDLKANLLLYARQNEEEAKVLEHKAWRSLLMWGGGAGVAITIGVALIGSVIGGVFAGAIGGYLLWKAIRDFRSTRAQATQKRIDFNVKKEDSFEELHLRPEEKKNVEDWLEKQMHSSR